MPYLIVEHPCVLQGQILENGWRVTCTYPDGTHCDIDVLDDNGELTDVVSETLLEGEYSYDYIYAHHRPHIEIGEA